MRGDGARDRVDDGEVVDIGRPYLGAVTRFRGLMLDTPCLGLGDTVETLVRAATGTGVQADAEGAPGRGLGLGDVLVGGRHVVSTGRTMPMSDCNRVAAACTMAAFTAAASRW